VTGGDLGPTPEGARIIIAIFGIALAMCFAAMLGALAVAS
jgi:hypothetical protein